MNWEGVKVTGKGVLSHVKIPGSGLPVCKQLPTVNWTLDSLQLSLRASQVALVVKNPSANAGDPGDRDSIPGLGRSPRGGNIGNHSSILAWKIPGTVEPGGLQSMGSQSWTQLNMHVCTHTHTHTHTHTSPNHWKFHQPSAEGPLKKQGKPKCSI